MSTRRITVVVAALVALALPATARADAVTEWDLNASNALFNPPAPNVAQAPNVGVLHMAMVQGAVYDAVNAIDRGHRSYVYFTNRVLPGASKPAAAATAAYRVLVSIVPAQQPALEQLYLASLAAIPDSSAKTAGIQYGEEAAAAMIADRRGDGRFGVGGHPVGSAPGQWRPTLPAFANDPAAWVRNVRPFMLTSPSQFRSPPPFPLSSASYAVEFNEVKDYGAVNSSVRNVFQTNSARYWADNSVRTWNRILRSIATQRGLTITENARLFALMTLAQADSIINVWDDKYFYAFWRPITAIQEAANDGNPATTADAGWLPLIPTPPYPDHTSGASCLAGAAARVLQLYFGTDNMAWTDTNFTGQTNSFVRLSDAEADVVSARVWGGLHFRRADVLGALIGRNVADYQAANFLGTGRR
jgi:hypothetical protein